MFRGGRRWYAFLTKGIKIPARVIDVNDKDVLWKSYEENAFRTDLMPDEEAEHILRLIDAELKGTEGYEKCNNDPKKALSFVFHAKQGREIKKIGKDVLTILGNKLNALFASLPRTRVLSLEHFYANEELKGTEEYNACNSDPKKALAVVFNAKQGWKPKEPTPYSDVAIRNLTQKVGKVPKEIINDVVNNWGKKLDGLFASLPRTRKITLDSFYAHNLSVLKLSESTRTKLRHKEVRGSASAEEAIASIKDRPDA